MKRAICAVSILLLSVLFFSPSPWAEEQQQTEMQGFLFLQEDIPTVVVAARISRRLVAVDSLFFPFQLGGTTLPATGTRKFNDFIFRAKGKELFFRGTADANSWKKYPSKEEFRLDLDLANARAKFARDRAGRGYILSSATYGPQGRGVMVYAVTYEDVPNEAISLTEFPPDGESEQDSARADESGQRAEKDDAGQDSDEEYDEEGTEAGWGDIWVVAAVGYKGFYGQGMRISVPTVSGGLRKGRGGLWVSAGWRPVAANSSDALGSRAQTLVSVELHFYPESRLYGLYAGFMGAWETLRSTDRFIQRAYGFSFGARSRPFGNAEDARFFSEIEVGCTIANFNKFGEAKDRWGFGMPVAVRIGFVF